MHYTYYGGIAQLGERLHGMQEVRSSILLISTIKNVISTRFISRVGIFIYGEDYKGRPKGGPFTKITSEVSVKQDFTRYFLLIFMLFNGCFQIKDRSI